jgi:hypothetical protein
MGAQRISRAGVFAIVVVAVALLPFVLGSLIPASSAVGQYVEIDETDIALRVANGKGAEAWVASVVESATTVTVDVRKHDPIRLGPTTAEAYPRWVVAHLEAPLAGRRVIDASSGETVPRRP